MPTSDINLLAVLAATVATMVLGMFWYSPAGFGKAWMALMKFKKEDMEGAKQKGMGKYYAGGFVVAFITAYVLAHFADYVQATDAMDALQLAFWLWLGFVAAVSFNHVLWEGRPVKLYAINVGYTLVSLVISALILVLWK